MFYNVEWKFLIIELLCVMLILHCFACLGANNSGVMKGHWYNREGKEEITWTMSLSAKRPLDDTLTSSPSNSSIAASEKTHLFDLHALRYHHPFPHNIQCIETVWISVPSVNAGDCLLFLIVITIILCVYLPERGCICLCMCLCVCVRRLEADVS